jgi:hypothetical protein
MQNAFIWTKYVIRKDVVRVDIVLKTRIGLDAAAGVESNTGFQYNTDEYNIFPYCTVPEMDGRPVAKCD